MRVNRRSQQKRSNNERNVVVPRMSLGVASARLRLRDSSSALSCAPSVSISPCLSKTDGVVGAEAAGPGATDAAAASTAAPALGATGVDGSEPDAGGGEVGTVTLARKPGTAVSLTGDGKDTGVGLSGGDSNESISGDESVICLGRGPRVG
jgi:hypothetical protein